MKIISANISVNLRPIKRIFRVKMKKVFIIALLFLSFTGCAIVPTKKDIIAYSRLTDGYWQIWIRDIEGITDYQLTKTQADKRHPDWSSDGKRLIYRTNNGNIFVINQNGSNEQRILTRFENMINPRWSPDNKRLTFTRYRTDIKDDSDIWISDLKGDNPTMLTHNPGLQYQSTWSPDGKKILFVSKNEAERHHILLMDLKDMSSQPLTDKGYYNILPAWSPNGEKIAFVSNISGNYDIWIMDNHGKNLRQVTKFKGLDTSPAWSSDGSRIAFVSNREGNLHIWLIGSTGDNLKPLTKGETECRDPAFK